MSDYLLLQTKGRSPDETGNTIGCEWTLYKNNYVIKVFYEYCEAIEALRKFEKLTK